MKVWQALQRARSSAAARGTKACSEIVSSIHRIISLLALNIANSAANDYWGKTYLKLTGQSKMSQELAILTGSSAGATESFVVVPFELVKIK